MLYPIELRAPGAHTHAPKSLSQNRKGIAEYPFRSEIDTAQLDRKYHRKRLGDSVVAVRRSGRYCESARQAVLLCSVTFAPGLRLIAKMHFQTYPSLS